MSYVDRIRLALTHKCAVIFPASRVLPDDQLQLVDLAIAQKARVTITDAGAMAPSHFQTLLKAAARDASSVVFEF